MPCSKTIEDLKMDLIGLLNEKIWKWKLICRWNIWMLLWEGYKTSTRIWCRRQPLVIPTVAPAYTVVEFLSEMFLVLDQPCSLAGEPFGGDCVKDGSDAESQWEPKRGEDDSLFVGIDLSLPILSEIPLLRSERCWELRASEGLQIGRSLRSNEETAGRVQFADDGGGELSAMVSRLWFWCSECFRL